VTGIAFGPDGRVLLTASGDGRTRLLDIARSRQPAWAIPPASSIAFSPDGRTIAAGDSLGQINLWDAVARRARDHALNGHFGAVESLAFSPRDGRVLASAGQDGTIRLWHVATQTLIVVLGLSHFGREGAGGSPAVHSIAFHPDGRVLASGSDDGTIRLWDVSDPSRTSQIGQALTGHVGPVYAVAFSPDGRTLASAGDDGTVRLWQGILWSDLDDLQRLVCSIVGTGLSREEWARYASGTPYNRGCR
jgi:WD40 repeat protein